MRSIPRPCAWTCTDGWRGSWPSSRLLRPSRRVQAGAQLQPREARWTLIPTPRVTDAALRSAVVTAAAAASSPAAASRTATTPSGGEGATTTAPGLYGVPGLHTPEDLISLATRIVLHCQELQLLLELGSVAVAADAAAAGAVAAAASAVRRHHEAVSWLKPLAEHCAAHHTQRAWRRAAGRAVRALQAVEELLADRLAERPEWGWRAEQLTGLRPGQGPEVAAGAVDGGAGAAPQDADRAPGAPEEKKEGSRLGQLAPPASLGGPGGAAAGPSSETSAGIRGEAAGSSGSVGSAGAERQGVRTSGSEAAVAAAASGAPAAAGAGGELRLVSEAVSRAIGMTGEERGERRALEALEGRLVAAFRAALTDPRVVPAPLVVLHDSEVRGDPLLARHVTPATEAEVAAARARASVTLPLVLPPEGEEEEAGEAGEAGEVGAGEEPVAEVELGPVAAATTRALTRGGRLWSLRLTGPLTSLLLAEHPSSQVRRAVAAVTHGSQAAAALRFMDLLRPLRDELAVCMGQPSYAHLKMAGSVAADPRVALALLADILSAVRPLADQEVAAMQELQMRLVLQEEEEEERGRGRGRFGFGGRGGGLEATEAEVEPQDPLDLRGSVDFLTALQRPPPLGAEQWRELAPFFTIEGLLQGLSRQLAHVVGVELRNTALGPSELWHPGSVIRLELREAAGAGAGGGGGGSSGGRTRGSVTPGDLLGVLYVYLDPDCDLPYTVLVRHGYEGYDEGHPAPWLQPNDHLDPPSPPSRFQSHPEAPPSNEPPGPPEQQTQHSAAADRDRDRSARPRLRRQSHQPPTAAAAAPAATTAPAPAAAAPAPAAVAAAGSERRSGGCVPHVALHLPAGQVTQGPGGFLVPEHPGLIRTLAHEMGHALHYVLSYSPGSLPDSNACFSSTDFLELPSHILERWAADPRVISDLSCHALSGARLPPRRCASVAATPGRQPTWLELQQHTLAAAADLLMHLHGHAVDLQRLRLVPQPPPQPPQPPSPAETTNTTPHPSARQAPPLAPEAPASPPGSAVLDLESVPSLDLVSALWAEHSSLPGGSFQPTRGLMALLPGLLHNGAAMYSYPAAQLVAAAVWERHFEAGEATAEEGWGEGGEAVGLLGSVAAARCGRLLRRWLLEVGEPGGAAAALEALLGPGSVRRVRMGRGEGAVVQRGRDAEGGGGEREDGGVDDAAGCVFGVIPDLAQEAFQGADPLVF
ncbi:Mitochondrial intermediate peptidase [Pleodorina starrii]|uniref:Mitochondrial intermediate peptidase n=1 Tax=Pleodorina starrii TaxID=330485 RepID=A0A9W6BVP8_9CHLO|nr:Mitochondrial intermediate peptidase [Pleodorina starrii]